MIVRFGSLTVAPARRTALAAVVATVVASSGIQHAAAANAPAAAHAGSGASAAAVEVVGHYTVRAGQSLNDVAAELAQTHDKATLARVSRALFDANPDAFMKHRELLHDPSRLKIGAVLAVPAMPGIAMGASGAAAPAAEKGASTPVAGAAASGAAGASAASAAASNSSSSSTAAAGATGASTAQATTAAVGASAAQAGSAATGASAVSAAAAAPATSSSADVAAGASAASTASASAAAAASAASAASSAAAASATPASDAHVWSGAIQAAPGASSGASAAAGQPQAPVSSIQELLALKNRVLMALQKHGIGKAGQAGSNVPRAAAPSAPAAGTAPAEGEAPWSPSIIGIAAAFAAVVLLLLIRLMMRRRKPESQPPGGEADAHAPTQPTDGGTPSRKPETSPVVPAAAAAAGVAAASHAGQPHDEPQQRDARDQTADAAGAEALPTPLEAPHGEPLPADDANAQPRAHDVRSHDDEPQPRGVEPGEPETLADAAGAASLEAAAVLGASALSPESLETVRAQAEEAERAQRADDEQHEAIAEAKAVPPEQPILPAADELPSPAPAATQPAALTEFPADAVAALDTLDMPLPPRSGEPAGVAPLPTGPAASPQTIERQSVPLAAPAVPPAGGAIEAGPAGAGSIAGLGAARFGTLSLDFDLNLPPDSAEPLPVFTPEQLARIARNKLDLAHEYIALGDLIGARTLINEVIESNDLATRADAQALLATLAPMS